jgi:hypothetical protein
MVKINYQVLEFDHVVEFTKDSTVFAAARENGSGHLRLFLINELTGHVYTRNGRIDSWEELFGSDRDNIISRITAARNNHIPVYRINGSTTLTTGGSHN